MRKNQFILLATLSSIFFVSAAFAVGPDGTISINNEQSSTRSRDVRLSINPPGGMREMRISNSRDLSRSGWEPIRLQRNWVLDFGVGSKSVYVQFRDGNKATRDPIHDTIALVGPRTTGVSATINNNKKTTDTRRVQIKSDATEGIESVAITNNGSFSGVRYMPFQKEMDWILSPGSGEKTVTLRYRDINGERYDIEKKITYNEPLDHLPEGSLLKGDTDTVYYLGYGGQIHPFLHSSIFLSYRTDFREIRHLSNTRLREYFIGEPVCLRPGAWLFKFRSIPKVYAAEPGCDLRPIRSEAEAHLLYGPQWATRIVELDPIFSSYYQVHELTEHSRTEDRDRDGVDRDTEERYGTSDTKEDTDGDSVSDYEEIFYWISDPTRSDTDGDGILDGREIMQGRSPIGAGIIEEIPEDTYAYPFGTMVYRWWDDKDYYYYHQDGYVYYMSSRTNDDVFTTNRLQERFVVSPPIPFIFEPREGWYIGDDELFIKEPLTRRNGAITPL